MLATHLDGNLAFLRWAEPGAPLLVFSTRRGGTSPPPFDTLNLGLSTDDDPARVAENRRRLLAALELDPDRLVTAGQVHGAGIARAEAPGHRPRCDALVSTRRGLALAVTAADCAPVLLWAAGAAGAAHAGWRGAAAGIAALTARSVAAAGRASPALVSAVIGPCIRACCYRVGPDVAARFDPSCIRAAEDGPCLDLPRCLRLDLERAGVGRVLDSGRCTACEPDWFFSHRRDHARTGRQWGIVALPPGDGGGRRV